MTMPPPTPNSPEKNPATVPISPSLTVRACGMRGILGRVSAALTLAEALEVVRADPSRSAILLDVDGTLAPTAPPARRARPAPPAPPPPRRPPRPGGPPPAAAGAPPPLGAGRRGERPPRG